MKVSFMLRFGLCCIFREQPIKFRTTTVTAISKMNRNDAEIKLSALCSTNADSLMEAINFCIGNKIGCFRVTSRILPIKTHDIHGYNLIDLPNGEAILEKFRDCGKFAAKNNIRLCFHPDQFVVLNSQKPEVVENSLKEFEYQAEVAEWIGADVVNIHAGGVFGSKSTALAEFAKNINRLSDRARTRLTVENDDKNYHVSDLLPICRSEGIGLVYDGHHHRCNQDELSIEEATTEAISTWNREPLFHISSPIGGWEGKNPQQHHDFIDVCDFPDCWKDLDLTVEVEAKAKEVAILQLMESLEKN